MFISFEGLDFSGKTTQIRRVEQYLKDRGLKVITVRDPGGTPLGEVIRKLLKEPKENQKPCDITSLMLFLASRAQLVHDVIKPALVEETFVLADRFSDSTVAYQVGGMQLNLNDTATASEMAEYGCAPDLTFYLDVSEPMREKRRAKEGRGMDAFDALDKEFFNRVRAAYEERFNYRHDVYRIGADAVEDDVFKNIKSVLDSVI